MKVIVKATAKCKGGFEGYYVGSEDGICCDEFCEEIPVFGGTRGEAYVYEFEPELEIDMHILESFKAENIYEYFNVNPKMTELSIEVL